MSRRGVPLDEREVFRELLRQDGLLRDELRLNPLREEYAAEVIALAQQLKPKAKNLDLTKAIRVIGADSVDVIGQRYRTRVDAWYEDIKAKRKAIQDQLDETATRVAVSPGEEWYLFDCVWVSSYSTQGWGANAYAKGAANLSAMTAQGFAATKVEAQEAPARAYAVYVQVAEELDVEIIKRKPSLSLRDWLKACWKQGTNPRVFNPYLPHGLEEKLGIDYQGNDKAP